MSLVVHQDAPYEPSSTPLGRTAYGVSPSHGFRSVRLAADFAPPVATSLSPYGVKREPPILSRTRPVRRCCPARPSAGVGIAIRPGVAP